MILQRFHDRRALARLARDGVEHVPAQKVAGDTDQQAEQERDAPPPELSDALDIAAAKPAPTAEPSRMPPHAPHDVSAPISPRRPSGAHSTRNTMDI